MARYFVGVDVHGKHTSICVLNGDGKRIKRLTIRNAWSQIAEALRRLPGDVAVCFKASTAYGYLYEMLTEVASRVLAAHPGQLRLIFRSKQKNDPRRATWGMTHGWHSPIPNRLLIVRRAEIG